jgi:SAM-dependent methyltransferase
MRRAGEDAKGKTAVILGEQVMEEIGTGQAHVAARWLPSGQRLLEIGCSSGYLTRRFLHKAERVCGLDMNASALRYAKRRHPNVPFVCGNAEHLPFASDSFDVVLMLEVIEHTYSDVAALAEIRRVLKVGGTLVLSTPNAGLFAFLDPYNFRLAMKRRFSAAYSLAGRLVRFESGQCTDNLEWHRHYQLEALTAMLDPGFAIRDVYRGGLCLYPLSAATISLVARLWNSPLVLRWLFRVLNWDFRLRFGWLSYNLMILAERMR